MENFVPPGPQSLYEAADYRDYLKSVFEKRVDRNKRYSMRAFARSLKIPPQNMALILAKKRSISLETAVDVGFRLGLDAGGTAYFCDLVLLSTAKGHSRKKLLKYKLDLYEREVQYKLLKEDVFHAISDWQHVAFMELTQTKDFNADPTWCSKRLGIPPARIDEISRRLLRLGLIKEDGGRFMKVELNLTTFHDIPSSALRAFASQLLELGRVALDSQLPHERDITTMTMAVDPGRLKEAKSMIREFRRKLCRFLEQGERTEVYAFVPALFRITKKRN